MNKMKFLKLLEQRLQGLPDEDIINTIEYWDEIISDKVEDGMEEKVIINDLNIDEIVEKTFKEIPLKKLIKAKVKKTKGWTVAFWISTFYIWLPILVSLFAVGLALYVSLWAIVISIGASAIACVGAGLLYILTGIIKCFTIDTAYGWLFVGIGIFGIGLGILFAVLTVKLVKWLCIFSKKLLLWTKLLFIRRGDKNEA